MWLGGDEWPIAREIEELFPEMLPERVEEVAFVVAPTVRREDADVGMALRQYAAEHPPAS